MMNEDRLESLIRMFRGYVMGVGTNESAEADFAMHHGEETAEKVRKEYEKRIEEDSRTYNIVDSLENSGIAPWYSGPDFPGAIFWPAYKEQVRKKGWDENTLTSIDEATTKIMSSIQNPRQDSFNGRGLVLGYVQSGKTANYAGLIAKAMDAGYKAVIVLAGITNSLRNQTQGRLEREIKNPNEQCVKMLTSSVSDFTGAENANFDLSPEHEKGRVIGVVKKHYLVLEKLIKFFEDADPGIKRQSPVLVIDDEADHASINTKRKAGERSTTNEKLVRLMQVLPKVSYVGYTATPFANIFIDPTLPDGLYPRDFLISLKKPDRYYGAETIFGREPLDHESEEVFDGLDVVRSVEKEAESALQPASREDVNTFKAQRVDSIENATKYFLLSCAERLARGQKDHSSMLIHTSLYTDVHDELELLMKGIIGDIKRDLVDNPSDIKSSLRELFDRERAKVGPEDVARAFDQEVADNLDRKDFEEVWAHLEDVVEEVTIAVDNGRRDGVSYDTDEERWQTVIAIGGNTLSRGLTLEGLIVSYFLRPAAAYDTLLQMGRWFGYRIGYEDIPRIWMTDELRNDFFHLSTVEEELRDDVRRYDDLQKTPEDFGVRIRTHPSLRVTSRMKMQQAEITAASFSESHIQTFVFDVEDVDVLKNNQAAVRSMVEELQASGEKVFEISESKWLFRSVDARYVLDFLEDYSVVEKHADLHRDLVSKYILEEMATGSLEKWNIAILGTPGSNREYIDLGLPEEVGCVYRSKINEGNPANIKGLTSSRDRVVDIDEPTSGPLKKDDILRMRAINEPKRGLLMVYPIDKDSPGNEEGSRADLDAEEHVIGLGMMFPKSEREQSDYVANALKDVYDGTVLEDEVTGEEGVDQVGVKEIE